jgi:hypothetical protein
LGVDTGRERGADVDSDANIDDGGHLENQQVNPLSVRFGFDC